MTFLRPFLTFRPVGDAVQELDGAVGELLDFLDANRVADSTLVFFTSDNGAPLSNDCVGNGVLRDGKFTTWDGGIKVGGIMRWPGRVPAGRVSPALVATYDIFATVVAASGAAPPTDRVIDGIDLVEVVATNASGHACLFHYHAACATLANTTKGENRCAFMPGTQGAAVGGVSTGIAAVTCGTHKLHFCKSRRSHPACPTWMSRTSHRHHSQRGRLRLVMTYYFPSRWRLCYRGGNRRKAL